MKTSASGLWFRWIAANALGELFGLGITFSILGIISSKFIGSPTTASVIVLFIITVLTGSIEATIVSLAQFWAMHPWFPKIEPFGWWRATLIGALIGYILGYLPSTIMNMGEAAGQAPMVEPPQWLTLLLAAGLGAVAGMVLSFAQYLMIRGKVAHAGIWIPANMLAWAFGMPVIFQAIDWGYKVGNFWAFFIIALGLLAAGAVVGLIHGRALVYLVGHQI